MANKPEQRLVRFDWAMKNILRNKANFDILEGFLTCLLNEKIIVKKFCDIKNRNVIECVTSENFPRIISVDIVYAASLKENKDYIYCSSVNVVGRHSKNPLLTKFDGMFPEYYIIYVDNFNNEVRSAIDEWLYFFKNESIKANFTAPGIKAAGKKLEYLKMSEQEKKAYDRYKDELHYESSTLATSIAEGRREGKAEGRLEGERAKAIETASQMLSDGVSVENIAKWTGLSESEILALKKRK